MNLCFHVTGEGLTHRARDFAREGSYDLAMSFLMDGLQGMTSDIATKILMGNQKLVGSSAKTPDGENSLRLEDDSDPEYLDEILTPT